MYDDGVTLPETSGAMEHLVDEDECHAIGLSDARIFHVKRHLRQRLERKYKFGTAMVFSSELNLRAPKNSYRNERCVSLDSLRG